MSDVRRYAIAVIPGDGIGQEVTPAALEVLEAAGRTHGFELALTEHPWGCDHFVQTGRMMPADALETLRDSDAIFLGAVGRPDVPDHVSLWGLLIPVRRAFRQYVNLRPVRLWPGIPSPLRDVTPDDVDMVIVRENNEGAGVRAPSARTWASPWRPPRPSGQIILKRCLAAAWSSSSDTPIPRAPWSWPCWRPADSSNRARKIAAVPRICSAAAIT